MAEFHNGGLERRLTVVEKILDLHDIDLYKGRGKVNPPITTRLTLLEDTVGKISKNLNRIVWLLLATLVGVVANFIIHR